MLLLFSSSILVLFSFFPAQGAELTFEQVDSFHQKSIQQNLKSYGLSSRVEVSYTIEMRDSYQLKEKVEPVELPGLLMDPSFLEDRKELPTLQYIIRTLPAYKRNLSIVTKEKVDVADIDNLKAALKDSLLLQPDEPILQLDKSFNLDQILADWEYELTKTFYNSFVKSGSVFWTGILLVLILIFFPLTYLALRSIFVGSARSLGQSIEKSIDNIEFPTQQTPETAAAENKMEQNSPTSQESSDALDELKKVNMVGICSKINASHTKFGDEIKGYLWDHLPDPYSQLQFYEFVEKTEFPNQDEKENTIRLLESAFTFNQKSIKKPTQNTPPMAQVLKQLNEKMIEMRFQAPSITKKKVYGAVFPKYGLHKEKIVESATQNYFSLLYFLFPKTLMTFLKAHPEVAVENSAELALIGQINEASFQEVEVKGFLDFLESSDFQSFINEDSSEFDEELLGVLYSLPEETLESMEVWENNSFQSYRSEIPKLNWIRTDDRFAFKKFIDRLTVNEIQFLNSQFAPFKDMLIALDERSRFRANEKINKEQSNQALDWQNLRNSIKECFHDPLLADSTHSTPLIKRAS